jgi:hypothetical protein
MHVYSAMQPDNRFVVVCLSLNFVSCIAVIVEKYVYCLIGTNFVFSDLTKWNTYMHMYNRQGQYPKGVKLKRNVPGFSNWK